MKTTNITAKKIFQLHESNAYTQLTGNEGDISNLFWFKWYDWCYFCDSDKAFPLNKENIGQLLGPVIREGDEMTKCILKDNSKVVPRRLPIPLQL